MLFFAAFGTDSLYDERDGMGIEAFGQRNIMHTDVLKAERARTRLTIEMSMTGCVAFRAMMRAKLVDKRALAVLKRMHDVVLKKKRKRPEDA